MWRHNGRLKSPASPLFTQPFIQAQIKENIKAPRHWPLCGEYHRSPVNSPHKWPVTRKLFPFDDVVMLREISGMYCNTFLQSSSSSQMNKVTVQLPWPSSLFNWMEPRLPFYYRDISLSEIRVWMGNHTHWITTFAKQHVPLTTTHVWLIILFYLPTPCED